MVAPIHAVDYLLKPFDRARFRTALNRARQRLQPRDCLPAEFRRHSFSSPSPHHDPVDFIPIRTSGRIRLLTHSQIDWISAADNYVELHVGLATYMLRSTITALADRLAFLYMAGNVF
jgi:two-component system LytT family response regulator